MEDGAFSHKIDYLTIFLEILNLEGHPNRITGSRDMAILMNWWILPIGGASAVEGLFSTEPTPSSFLLFSMSGPNCPGSVKGLNEQKALLFRDI